MSYTSKDLAILVPMLGRPWHVKPLLHSINETVPDARVLFIVTPDDETVITKLDKISAEYIFVEYNEIGDYARKINTGFRHTTEPLIFTGASDLYFHKNWFERATALLSPTVHVIGTNDMGLDRTINGTHSTHSLVTREYVDKYGLIDEPGKVLCEDYIHEFCDDELVQTAIARKAWAWSGQSFVEHMHPIHGKGVWDASYTKDRERMARSGAIYTLRSQLWTQQ